MILPHKVFRSTESEGSSTAVTVHCTGPRAHTLLGRRPSLPVGLGLRGPCAHAAPCLSIYSQLRGGCR